MFLCEESKETDASDARRVASPESHHILTVALSAVQLTSSYKSGNYSRKPPHMQLYAQPTTDARETVDRQFQTVPVVVSRASRFRLWSIEGDAI